MKCCKNRRKIYYESFFNQVSVLMTDVMFGRDSVARVEDYIRRNLPRKLFAEIRHYKIEKGSTTKRKLRIVFHKNSISSRKPRAFQRKVTIGQFSWEIRRVCSFCLKSSSSDWIGIFIWQAWAKSLSCFLINNQTNT